MPILLTAPSESERLGFTVAEVRAMVKAGILEEGGRYELLDGEIVPMQAHNPPHMRLKRWIFKELERLVGRTHWVDSEPTFYLEGFANRGARSFTAPDVIVYPLGLAPEAVKGADCDLLIEVASTTQKKDLGRKAALYAQHGVRDYWVCDTSAGVTIIHREPTASGYGSVTRIAFSEAAASLLLPGVTLRMSDAP